MYEVNKISNKAKMLFVFVLLVLTLFVFSINTINVSAVCDKTIFYRGICNPNGALSVHKSDGTLIASETAGVFRGCYNNLYFIEIGAGGSGCDWTPGEFVLFKINGQDVARVPWVGNDYTIDLNLGNQCGGNTDCVQQCPGQTYVLNGVCTNGVCSYTDTCPAVTPECRDRIDNDRDGYRDYPWDPGCETPDDNSELNTGTLPQCFDTVDNDGDGITDFPWDPGCTSAADNDERDTGVTECTDGIDNDGNTLIDFPWDPGCYAAGDDDEYSTTTNLPQCFDRVDNDADLIIDFPFDPGCYAAGDDDELDTFGRSRQCSDYIDNDGDGRIDYPLDLECWSAYDDDESKDTECMDGIDNDNDGQIDYAGIRYSNGTTRPKDTDCTSPFDPTESPPPVPQCDDNIDNDRDNRTDYPNDPGCTDTGDNNETDPSDTPECADGIDNDNDGETDYPDDDDCDSASDDSERGDGNGGGGGDSEGGHRRSGGGGTVGLPSYTGGGFCNICGEWGECKSSGLRYRNCTTVDCDALSVSFNAFEVIEEDGKINQTRKGRLVRPGHLGSFLNRNIARKELADTYNLTIVNFTKQTEFYDFYNKADIYILQSERCNYLGPITDVVVQANCYDGIKNQGEDGIDCGGPCVNQCIEQKGVADEGNCWVWWVILAILLVLLAILVYEHYREEKEILWWVWFAVILLIALDIGLLAVCVDYGFSWWMLLIFVIVLLGMLLGYVFFQKKNEDEKLYKDEERKERRTKIEEGFDKLGMNVPPSVKIGVSPKKEDKNEDNKKDKNLGIISSLSPSVKIEQINNLIKSVRDDLKTGDLKKIHQTTDKISAVYKSLPPGKQKDDIYKKFMKLYEDIKEKVK